jgi:hypothetical protein
MLLLKLWFDMLVWFVMVRFEGFSYIVPSFMASSMETLAAAKAAQQQ